MNAMFSKSAKNSGSPRTRRIARSPCRQVSRPSRQDRSRYDAGVLALYELKTTDLRLYVASTTEILALRDLKTRRDKLQQMLFAETNRVEHACHASVSRSLKAHIASLRKALAALEAEIAAHVKACETLARKARLMQTLKGVGPATVAAILAYMPELGAFTKGEAACIAGLAPINNDSGTFQGSRHIDMTALLAIQHNPVMRLFADKLRRSGKPSKVVIAAVMRKLIVTLNAILRSGEPWRHANAA